jgi:hypothetical protein
MKSDRAAPARHEPVLFSATVCTPVAPMHAEPRIASPMVSQQVSGHAVEVLEREGEWLRASGSDGYQGWMHQGFLMRLEAPPAAGALRISLGCVVSRPGQGRRALPLLAWLSQDDVVQSGEAIAADERASRFPAEADAIAATACAHFTGTSYLWGGVTPWGADCSGLAQTSYALHGLTLPRDAWQQAERGSDAGRDFAAFCPADLIFFSDRADGRITHVGMALGGGRKVHLALNRGGYRVERLDDDSDAFVCKLRERFVVARRLLP